MHSPGENYEQLDESAVRQWADSLTHTKYASVNFDASIDVADTPVSEHLDTDPDRLYSSNNAYFDGEEPTPKLLDQPLTPDQARRNSLAVCEAGAPLDEADQANMAKIINSVATLQSGPQAQQVFKDFGTALDWLVFGKEGEPLPDSLVIVHDKITGKQDVRVAPESPLFDYNFDHVADVVSQANQDFKWLWLSLDSRNDSQSVRMEAARDVLTASPAYKLVRSFDTEQPADLQELPLTAVEKLSREVQIEQAIRQRFGIAEAKPLARHSPAHLALTRAVYHLDEETSWKRAAPTTLSASEKFKTFFQPYLERACEETIRTFSDESDFSAVHEGKLLGRDYRAGYSNLKRAAELLVADLHDQSGFSGRTNNMQIRLVTDVAQSVYISSLSDFQTILREAVEGTDQYYTWYQPVENVFIETRSRGSYDYRHAMRRYQLVSTVMSWLKQPTGRIVELADYEAVLRDRSRGYTGTAVFSDVSKMGVLSAKEAMLDQQAVIGRVEKRHLSGAINRRRLVEDVCRQHDLPTNAERYDLAISFNEKLVGNYLYPMYQPFIAGYTLVAAQEAMYFFVADPDNDPYRSADLPIQDDQRTKLVNFYRNLGLEELPEIITNHPGTLSVSQLVDLIQQHSLYPTGGDVYGHPPDVSLTLQHLTNLVRDGKLVMQCSGAAQLLKESLNIMFGAGSARQVEGFIIAPRQKVITLARHAQVAFVHDGRRYILDATPSRKIGKASMPTTVYERLYLRDIFKNVFGSKATRQATSVARTFRKEQRAKTGPVAASSEEPAVVKDRAKDAPKAAPQVARPVVPSLDSATIRAEMLAQQKQAIRTRLEQKLQVIFGQPSPEHLYKQLNNLPNHDPIKRSLRTVIQASQDRLQSADVAAFRRYLETYKNTTPQKRRQVHLTSYDPQTLDVLDQAASELEQLQQQLA